MGYQVHMRQLPIIEHPIGGNTLVMECTLYSSLPDSYGLTMTLTFGLATSQLSLPFDLMYKGRIRPCAKLGGKERQEETGLFCMNMLTFSFSK